MEKELLTCPRWETGQDCIHGISRCLRWNTFSHNLICRVTEYLSERAKYPKPRSRVPGLFRTKPLSSAHIGSEIINIHSIRSQIINKEIATLIQLINWSDESDRCEINLHFGLLFNQCNRGSSRRYRVSLQMQFRCKGSLKHCLCKSHYIKGILVEREIPVLVLLPSMV